MFKINPQPTFKADVSITVPGQSEPATIVVEYKHRTREQITELIETSKGEQFASFVGDLIAGWEQVDEPFSQESLARLLNNYPAAGQELYVGFLTELTKAKRKN